ncbi:MAG: hypothetical protein GEV06_10610 [Luteitalea sp.]|nr:hypothetical protein [Luteitalea sp.]
MTERIAPRTTTTGLDPRLAAVLAYSAWWITGLVLLVLERDNRYVRFHALQALVGLGGLALLTVVLAAVSLLMLTVSYTAMRACVYVAQAVAILSILVWLVCIYKASRGYWWKLPLVGTWVERVITQ